MYGINCNLAYLYVNHLWNHIRRGPRLSPMETSLHYLSIFKLLIYGLRTTFYILGALLWSIVQISKDVNLLINIYNYLHNTKMTVMINGPMLFL